MNDTITLTIDGKTISVPPGTTILDAAAELGIEIPVICYHPHLTGNGLCRVCSVDSGGRVQSAACVTACSDGMSVDTNSDDVRRGRRTILELLASTVDLSEAQIIISAGKGVGGDEGLQLIRKLAGLFERSSIAASRAVCDSQWLPIEYQVGITGQTVAPKLYMACGISGAVQHTAAISNSRFIVAINKDPNALLFNIAHLGIIQDLHNFLPVLINKIQELKKTKMKDR